ncbi:MAG: 2-phosphosulfolactate phosphatase [Dehalococcoidia bacterium]|nr:2-phosphosulfolactate phosphatase [Dehalococcoidia bacterium]
MRIDVALLPGQAQERSRSVCVVVDVLRASSSIVTLLERGAACVVAARDIDEARRLHRGLPDHLLCGEKEGLPPEGFAYGNSPAEFSRLSLNGASIILATSNGTRLLAAAAAEAPVLLVGCLLNRTAVARAAIAIASERGLDIAVICSAAYAGSTFVLEDALGAGAIADAALRLGQPPAPSDAARFARDAFTVAQPHLRQAVASAYHAQGLTEAGLGDDVEYCARLDVSSVVPLLERGEDGLLRLVRQNRR